MSRFYVAIVTLALVGYCGPSAGIAYGQNPPVTWDNGYPEAHDKPFFGNMGSIEVFGSFNSGNLGSAIYA